MKKTMFFVSAIAALAMCTLFASCNGEETEPQPSSGTYAYLSTSSLLFPPEGGIEYVDISTDYSSNDLYVSYLSSWWYSLSHNENRIEIEVAPNTSDSPREVQIDLKSYSTGNTLATLSVMQYGNSGGNDDNPNRDDETPTAPTGVYASANGTSVSISWNSVSGATKYNVYRSSSMSGSFSRITSVSGTSATDNNPLNGSNYYKVTAVKGSKESDYSTIVSVSVSISQKPSTPTGLRAVQNGDAIDVSWNAVSGATFYHLSYKRPAPYDIEDFTNVYSTSTTMQWNTMVSGTYTFWVTAVGSDYTLSDPSKKVTCKFTANSGGGGDTPKKLDTPTNLEAYASPYDSYVQISFDEVPLAYQYELYRSTSASYGYTKITASGGSTSGNRYVLTDQNPKSGTTYYKVKAIALSYLGIADSDYSSYIKVTR